MPNPAALGHSVSFRHATPEDARAITEVRIETWRATYSEILDPEFLAAQDVEEGTARLHGILREESAMPEPKPFRLVALREGKVVGFCVCRFKTEAPFEADWFLHALYIHPTAQGLGIGGHLTTLAKEEGRSRGASRMVLLVFSQNLAAQGFYRATSAVHLGPEDFEIGGRTYPAEAFSYTLD